MSVNLSLRTLGHYLDQPALVSKVVRQAKWASLALATGVIGHDVYKATKENSPNGNASVSGKPAWQRVLLRDLLVIGATGIGTALATKKLISLKGPAFELGHGALAAMKRYPESLQSLLLKPFKSFSEMKQVIAGVPKDDLHQFLPVLEEAGDWEMLRKYSWVGLTSILSGMGGGWLANRADKMNDPQQDKLSDRQKMADMSKEGLFQFVANIFVCTVGTIMGLRTADKVLPKIANPIAKRLTKTVLTTTGLWAGIVGGGAIANRLGSTVVDPLVLGTSHPAQSQVRVKPEKRKIEFLDAVLHVDDIPLALALAGVTVLEPFIPLFFALSGYRTGIGYRNNQKKQTQPNTGVNTLDAIMQQAVNKPTPYSALHNNDSVFHSFMLQKQSF